MAIRLHEHIRLEAWETIPRRRPADPRRGLRQASTLARPREQRVQACPRTDRDGHRVRSPAHDHKPASKTFWCVMAANERRVVTKRPPDPEEPEEPGRPT